ncbi:internal scaffolding protein [Dipodfec virus UOA04_Rod_1082]|nr:internal scaffolding protein [Dipodfec virus UOA04_Rod_1082]
MKIFSRYSPPPQLSLVCESPSPVQQQFLEETQLDFLLKKYSTLGINPFVASEPQTYLDTSLISDFQTSQNRLVQLGGYFDRLPAQIRREFNDDLSTFVECVLDPQNESRLIDLGVLNAVVPPETKTAQNASKEVLEDSTSDVRTSEKSAQLPT